MINLFASWSTFNEFEGGISCSLLSKVIDCNFYRCAWECVHTSRNSICTTNYVYKFWRYPFFQPFLQRDCNCYRCAWVCLHTSRSPEMPYILLTRCTYSWCMPYTRLKDLWTDRRHVWITVSVAHAFGTVGRVQNIVRRMAKHTMEQFQEVLNAYKWMWGYLCFTSHCSLILSILP